MSEPGSKDSKQLRSELNVCGARPQDLGRDPNFSDELINFGEAPLLKTCAELSTEGQPRPMPLAL